MMVPEMWFGRWVDFYSFEDGIVAILDIFLCTAKIMPNLFRKFRKNISKQKEERKNFSLDSIVAVWLYTFTT